MPCKVPILILVHFISNSGTSVRSGLRVFELFLVLALGACAKTGAVGAGAGAGTAGTLRVRVADG